MVGCDDDDDDDDDDDELSKMKDPAGQVEASAQVVAQMQGFPSVPHGTPL